jgi:putative glutathione S-transferase
MTDVSGRHDLPGGVLTLAPGRYELRVSPADPASHQVLIVHRLLGLAESVDVAEVPADGSDAEPMPALHDRVMGTVVCYGAKRLAQGLCTEWDLRRAPGATDLFPRRLRAHCEAMSALAQSDIVDGGRRCGLATTEEEYADAFQRLFDRLEWFAAMLSMQRFILGPEPTWPDVVLFSALVRFDIVYHGLFRCNRWKLTESPVLWAYARDLYQRPEFGETADLAAVRAHYYRTYRQLNPGGIVPLGPDLSGWRTPPEPR